MAAMTLNGRGYNHAKRLILRGQIVLHSDWDHAQPSPREKDDMLTDRGRHEHAQWFLGCDPDCDASDDASFSFPTGDFERVHRQALLAAQQRATQRGCTDIAQAAGELIALIDDAADQR